MALQIPPNCDLTLGLVCTEKHTPGHSTWRMDVDERFLNPAGLVQGGFLSAMLDSAMGASAVTGVGDRRVLVVNVEMKVSFLSPARAGDRLWCSAVVVKAGSAVSFLEGRITNQRDELIATGTSTYLVRERTE